MGKGLKSWLVRALVGKGEAKGASAAKEAPKDGTCHGGRGSHQVRAFAHRHGHGGLHGGGTPTAQKGAHGPPHNRLPHYQPATDQLQTRLPHYQPAIPSQLYLQHFSWRLLHVQNQHHQRAPHACPRGAATRGKAAQRALKPTHARRVPPTPPTRTRTLIHRAALPWAAASGSSSNPSSLPGAPCATALALQAQGLGSSVAELQAQVQALKAENKLLRQEVAAEEGGLNFNTWALLDEVRPPACSLILQLAAGCVPTHARTSSFHYPTPTHTPRTGQQQARLLRHARNHRQRRAVCCDAQPGPRHCLPE